MKMITLVCLTLSSYYYSTSAQNEILINRMISKLLPFLLVCELSLFIYINSTHAQEIRIGDQTWATTNLDVRKFRNGDVIPKARSVKAWLKAIDKNRPAWCYYNNDPANGKKYGKLYNWYAIIDWRGLAPEGWHVPSDDEWTQLTDYLGGEEFAGKKLKSPFGWERLQGENDNSTNESGFTGLPGGLREMNGVYHFIGIHGYWWTGSEGDDFIVNSFWGAWYRCLLSNDDHVLRNDNHVLSGLSVRCLKD